MLVYGKYECFVMQMLYVCVLCASCDSSQCCILLDVQFFNAGLGYKRRTCGVVHDVRLYSVLDPVVISGGDVCCTVVFGTLVGVFVFSVM